MKKSLILRVGDIGWFLLYFFIYYCDMVELFYLYIVNVKVRKCIISLYWFGDKKKKFFKISFYEIKILMV